MRIDKVDQDALERAIEAARAEDEGRRHQIVVVSRLITRPLKS